MARSTHITYRMTVDQADAMDYILCACHDNEADKGADGYGVDLLDTIWTERCNMVNLKPVDGIIVWTLPRWFPLEMIVEQYGPDNHREDREDHDGNMVLDVYDQTALEALFTACRDALQSALVALYLAQERYETMGFYDDADNADEVAVIDNAIAAVKAVSFEDK
tara:strand:- start:2194 stop:2688 length:495 start_codon:yes stop_codon:yes gene_type:complete